VVTTLRTAPRILTSLSALALSIGALTGCTPEPEPTPTPTAAFASEEEAFTAAEEVYREYTDAVNEERAGDTNADPLSFLVGAALDGSLDTSNKLQAQGIHIVGDSDVLSFAGQVLEIHEREATIRAHICLDVSATSVIDSSGSDVTPGDRPGVIPLDVTFISSASGLLISGSDLAEETVCQP